MLLIVLYSLGLPGEITSITSCAIGSPSAILQVCTKCVYQISRAAEANNMYDSETHQQTRTCTYVLVRQDLLQHLKGVFQTFFSVFGVRVTFKVSSRSGFS